MTGTPPLLATPPGWVTRRGDGYAVHAHPVGGAATLAFAESVARGLSSHPRRLDCRFLYDDEGSRIFEEITRTAEYYQTRTEAALLREHAGALRELVGDATVVELGSGSSEKTGHLLRAWAARGPSRYVPIDVSEGALAPACARLARELPGLAIEGIAAPYEQALPLLPRLSPLLLVFLGSTVGNLDGRELDAFLEGLGRALEPGDRFLLGIDLVKDPARIEAAYDDAAGWSARFTRNLLARMNRELGCGIPLDEAEHVAWYDERLERVEIHARFRRGFQLELPLLGRRFRISKGEMIRTEISRKFRPERMAADLARHGFELERTLVDPGRLFGLLLSRRSGKPPARELRDELRDLLERARARTLQLVGPLDDDELAAQPDPLMSPLLWDMGHLAAYEERWLVTAVEGREGRDGEPLPQGLDGVYDSFAHPRAGRGALALPDRAATRQRLEEVRRRALAALERVPLGDAGPLVREGHVHRLVAQHEAQHQETMLQALGLRERAYELPLAGWRAPEPLRPSCEMVLVPGGPFLRGSDDRRAAYDNERPRHEVALPDFRIDLHPVTNGAFRAFVEEGGYRRRELWCEAGWAWREREGVETPLQWVRAGGGWQQRFFGRLRPLDPDEPVVHVSWFEASAYARFVGKRLPGEAEWEKAAAWDPEQGRPRTYPWGEAEPSPERANLDLVHGGPLPVGTFPAGASFYGCQQLLGDVWEWTASELEGYPGFRPFPYREYSEPFLGRGYRVLRGGSWATAAHAIRCTLRNWDLPQRRQLFAGFRCAAD